MVYGLPLYGGHFVDSIQLCVLTMEVALNLNCFVLITEDEVVPVTATETNPCLPMVSSPSVTTPVQPAPGFTSATPIRTTSTGSVTPRSPLSEILVFPNCTPKRRKDDIPKSARILTSIESMELLMLKEKKKKEEQEERRGRS